MNADFKLFYQAGNDLMIIILLFIIVASFHDWIHQQKMMFNACI